MTKRSIFFLWVLFSGAAALGCELLWIRYLTLVLGNTVYSLSWSTSLFMIGLALGSYLSPAILRNKRAHSLFLYGCVEVGTALFGWLSFYMLTQHQELLQLILMKRGWWGHGFISALLILPATTLMGMTLPLILNMAEKSIATERVYSWNIFGGSLGILFFGFILLKPLGYNNLTLIVPSVNLIIGLMALLAYKKGHLTQGETEEEKACSLTLSDWVLAAISGYLVLGMEVAWFRSSELIIGDRAYITSLVLLSVLTVLGLSSWIVTKVVRRWDYQTVLTFALICMIASLAFAEFFLPEAYYVYRGYPKVTYQKVCYLLFAFLMPLFFSGMLFPLILARATQNKSSRGRIVGKLLFINTIFGALGSLIHSYVLMENFGLASLYAAGFILAVVFLLVLLRENLFWKPTILFLILLTSSYFLLRQTQFEITEKGKVLVTRELPEGHFSLIKNWGYLEMYSGNYKLVSRFKGENVAFTQNALAYFPMMFHPQPKQVLTIGLGYGITSGAFLSGPIESLVSIEILKPVIEETHRFGELNGKYWEDPRLELIIEDGRRYFNLNKRQFDIISANVVSPNSGGGSLFYSKEFYNNVKRHLNERGIFAQLAWGNNLTEIFHTIKEVFPYVKVFPGYRFNSPVILASLFPLEQHKAYSHFESRWPKYKNDPVMNYEKLEKLGMNIWDKFYSQKPEFIITDERADLTFYQGPGMSFLWIYE